MNPNRNTEYMCTRKIDQVFVDSFKKTALSKLFNDHKDELFIGIRDGYMNIYHLCNSIAKVELRNGVITSKINPYYLDNPLVEVTPSVIAESYEIIKERSFARQKNEKQVQQKLVLLNNSNPESNWYCLDVEYVKPHMSGRFDIIAVSKTSKHRVALIEIKYSSQAFGGKSGILTHTKDYLSFLKGGNYEQLKQDIIGIRDSKYLLGEEIPDSVRTMTIDDFNDAPEFFFVTVNNNAPSPGAAIPSQSMAGYLFKEDNPKYKILGGRRHSVNAVEDVLGFDVTEENGRLHVCLLFTSQTVESLSINDIIDGDYEIRIPKMTSVFEEREKSRYNDSLFGTKYLNYDEGDTRYHPKYRLCSGYNNIYPPIQNDVIKYFGPECNSIKWWGLSSWNENGLRPTMHVLSSQVACVNHLFPFRCDKEAVLCLVHNIDRDVDDVLLLPNDTPESVGYISFEVVSANDNINEGIPTRGEFCTSIDALIVGVKKGKRVMYVIEWKYTETYNDNDLSIGRSGNTRLLRYSQLIANSFQLKSTGDDLHGSVFFFDPFYQLMRQTVWAENFMGNNTEWIRVDDYIHVHVIPSNNADLLNKTYACSGKRLEETWRDCLHHQEKYKILSPEELLDKLCLEKYGDIIDYLKHRYWV